MMGLGGDFSLGFRADTFGCVVVSVVVDGVLTFVFAECVFPFAEIAVAEFA